jgi:hypothetical protein
MRSLMICTNYYSGDPIEKNEMGEGEQVYTGCSWRNLRERNNLEDPGIDGK